MFRRNDSFTFDTLQACLYFDVIFRSMLCILYIIHVNVRVVQLEGAYAVNHAIGRLSPCCTKLTRSLQQASNPKIAGSFISIPKLGDPVYHNNIAGTLKTHLCPSHMAQVLRLPGAVNPDVLHSASLRITQTVPEVVDAENQVTSSLPFLLDPTSVAKMQS